MGEVTAVSSVRGWLSRPRAGAALVSVGGPSTVHAFNVGAGDNPGKVLDNPASTALINTAGGKDKAAAFCLDAPGEASHGHLGSHPTGVPSSHRSRPENTPSHPFATSPTTHGD